MPEPSLSRRPRLSRIVSAPRASQTGHDTSVMMRSIPLRGFDQQMAGQIKTYMEDGGINFISGCSPDSVELTPSGKKLVKWHGGGGGEMEVTGEGEFDTVLLAVGREVCTGNMGLASTGVTLNPKNGKIPTKNEASSVPHIYAIGDVIDGDALSPPSALTELTPVAIQAGKLLANRLYGGGKEQMDYLGVPTTVYTPLEYGCVGYTEEEAEKVFGAGGLKPDVGIEVFHTYFKPLEWTVPHRGDNACYCKLICDKADNMRVVGLHICGPNAGEMTQGFAVALKCGATKDDFDRTVGIHPTNAEWLTTMHITKASGESAETTGC